MSMSTIKALLKSSMDGYNQAIEADLQEWIKIYPIEEMTIIRGNLPKGVTPLREYCMQTNEGHVIDRQWLVHNRELKGIVDELDEQSTPFDFCQNCHWLTIQKGDLEMKVQHLKEIREEAAKLVRRASSLSLEVKEIIKLRDLEAALFEETPK